ncbi:hypothetical protein HYDPIDRAFT_115903 [Hydnomerulius pinastri MD-312]|uniref:Uncharacterized protein n=1 Tax=Hydnomerulius pinastri MD-312 TaxID=994086 RepID=A0A0C9WC74_9AGAM|nr:hypothetical protein HYDPIDRAFT_115903 [Hydnomerulius pinastri MD-312]
MADPLHQSLQNTRFANKAVATAVAAGALLFLFYSPATKRNQGDLPTGPRRTSGASVKEEDKATKIPMQSGKTRG